MKSTIIREKEKVTNMVVNDKGNYSKVTITPWNIKINFGKLGK